MRIIGVLAALVLAGCGAVTGTATPADQTTTTTSTATTTPKPAAKDGTDYAACADGNCEVAVDAPVTIGVSGHSFAVKTIEDDRITYELTLKGGGTASGSLGGACVALVEFKSDGSGSFSTSVCGRSSDPEPAPEPRAGRSRLQISGLPNGAAIIQVVTA